MITMNSAVERQSQFQALAVPVRQRLFKLALRILHNRQDAEDVVQEAFVRAWLHFDGFDPDLSFEAWMFRIANNLIIDHIRRRKRRPTISLEMAMDCLDGKPGERYPELSDGRGDPHARLLAYEISDEMVVIIGNLPSIYQTTLMLVAQERSYEEIARAMDCPLGTVRSRVHRARAMLRHNLIK